MQLVLAEERIKGVFPRLHALAQGGTAVGTVWVSLLYT